MGLLGQIIGGGLQGLGTGIVQDVAQRREAALTAMKIKYAQDKDAADAATAAANRKEDRANKVADQKTELDSKVTLLTVGGKITENLEGVKTAGEIKKIQTKAATDMQIERFKAQADLMSQAAKDAQGKGEVIGQPEVGKDGQFYLFTKGGSRIATGVMASPTAAEKGDRGGGRLTDGEQTAAYDDAKKEWRDAGRKGPEPKRSDFIGRTRQEFAAAQSGAKASPAVSPPVAKPAQQKKPQANVVSMSDYNAGLQVAIKKRASGVPGYAGLNDAQLRKKLEDVAKAAGYTLPTI